MPPAAHSEEVLTELRMIGPEAELYSSRAAAPVMAAAEEAVDAMTDETDDYNDLPALQARVPAIRALADELRSKATLLAQAGRPHLGLRH